MILYLKKFDIYVLNNNLKHLILKEKKGNIVLILNLQKQKKKTIIKHMTNESFFKYLEKISYKFKIKKIINFEKEKVKITL